ncbi:MAG: hypothetical protein P4L92_04005 [Rudaea sp.]|nr:hypothetical protein [Rudaea sp.]
MKIDDFISVHESEEVPEDADRLFQRKYGRPVPDFPHHVIATWRTPEGASLLVCYVHFTDCGDILLGGGACTNDRVLRQTLSAQRDAVRAAGGIYQHVLQWSVRHFSARFGAIFGYCGNALAERIDRAVGFQSTPHEHLLVYWAAPIDERRRRQMIAKAHSFSPF